jgi:hypothetical protein
MTQHSLDFKHFDVEMYFARRLAEHGRHVFTGLSDPTIRKDRIRQAILDAHMDCTIIGKNAAGKPETYAICFERLFHEPLVPKTKGKRHAET